MATLNVTNITPPRVPLTDERTGLISREWYRFFLNLFVLTGSGTSQVSLADLQIGPPNATVEDLQNIKPDQFGIAPAQESNIDQIAELQKQIEALQVAPQFDPSSIFAIVNSLRSAPVVKTANFTVADNETWLINNKSGSSCTVTLPSATTNTGRTLYFQNYQSQTLVSASSNVVPLVGGAAGTAILAAVAGETATIVSDGTSWIMTQYVPNNVLLLE